MEKKKKREGCPSLFGVSKERKQKREREKKTMRFDIDFGIVKMN